MQIVTDRAADLSPEQQEGLDIFYAPLTIILEGREYISGVDIEHEAFYALLESTRAMPTTSLPSAGELAAIYRQLAAKDPDILSVHISSGLSGTFNAARQAVEMVPEANVTAVDTRTLSGAQGWQVEAAARAVQAGWGVERIKTLLGQIGAASDTVFTLPDLGYLIHGGRISHLTGLLASALNIRPIIGVDKSDGKYAQLGRARTFKRAVEAIGDIVAKQHPIGTKLRVQIMHGLNLEAAEQLRARFEALFECTFLPLTAIAPVLGAHTGPGLVGAAYAPLDTFPAMP
jgi:DegV family protein with EDD domain